MCPVKRQILFGRTTIHPQKRLVKSGVAIESVFHCCVNRLTFSTYFRQCTIKTPSVYICRQRHTDHLSKHTLDSARDRIARHTCQLFCRNIGFQILFNVSNTCSDNICILHKRSPFRYGFIISHKIGKNISCSAVIEKRT